MSKKRAILAAVVLALVLCIGGVLAYFSDSEKATNTFTVGKISIKLTEASWDENNAKKILPNQLIAKDPKLTNNGVNDAYVFMEVLIPTASIVVEAQDGSGNATTGTTQEMFTLINSSGAVGVNSEWQLIDGPTEVTESNKTYKKYVYAYAPSSSALTKLTAGSSTVELFNKVRFANVQENWGIEGESYNVIVTGYAIQTENLSEYTNPTPAQAWSVLSANAIHTGSIDTGSTGSGS